ncbi:Imidazolonepropionase [Fodinibius roseus]|uniref:Imidazolonepropionase n=2 Tax=Fodinibius roseus TaxID=1194090 RepID=A0A1M5C6A3_9BACT|nr:Imidazolonepropionase [Fodinibius roseus]
MAASLQGWSQPAEAFENVIIHTADGEVVDGGTIVWRDGIIRSVGPEEEVTIPFDAYVRDGGDSLHVYPGFIDGMALWGSPDTDGPGGTPDEPGNPGYKRAGIQPQRYPSEHLKANDQALEKAAEMGFTTAALGLKGQMLPGQVDLFFIRGKQTPDNLLEEGVGVLAQFKEAKGPAYPSTTMGLMAQFRQLFYDAEALHRQQEYFASVSSSYPAPQKEKELEALYPVMKQKQPFFFVADSKENIERVLWLQDELGFDMVLVSGKEAYTKAQELRRREIPVLAGIDLPEKPDWMSTDDDGKDEKDRDTQPAEVTEEMQHFRERQQQAYKERINNINTLRESGVRVGYSSNGFNTSAIRKNLLILKEESGMNESQLLNILTQSTADILGYGQRLGDLEEGRLANFTVFDNPFTEEKAKGLFSVSNGEVTELDSESSN